MPTRLLHILGLLSCKGPAQHQTRDERVVSIRDFVSDVLHSDQSLAANVQSPSCEKQEPNNKKLRRICGVFIKRASSGRSNSSKFQARHQDSSQHSTEITEIAHRQSHDGTEYRSDSPTSTPTTVVQMPSLLEVHQDSADSVSVHDPGEATDSRSLGNFMREYAPGYSARHRYEVTQLPAPQYSTGPFTDKTETFSERTSPEDWETESSWATISDCMEVDADPPRLPSVELVESIGTLRDLRETLRRI